MYHSNVHTKMRIFNVYQNTSHRSFGRTVGYVWQRYTFSYMCCTCVGKSPRTLYNVTDMLQVESLYNLPQANNFEISYVHYDN